MDRIGPKEREYVLQVLDSQFRTSAGSMMTQRLEGEFAKVFESKYSIAFVNGTATMHAALVAAGVGPGDEVIVPPLTMASTSFVVLQAGATPVFADVDPQTWNIDPASIRERITPKTKAIIPVDLFGLPANMSEIMEVAAQHDLFVLEDAAQCFLGYCGERVVGSIAHASSFSFQSTKHMTSGEGGMITTNDEELANDIRRFNSLGYAGVGAGAGKGKISKDTIQDPEYERHVSLGWNYRMPELCAAVSLAQLERLQELVDMRKRIAELYAEASRGCEWLIPQAVPDGYVHSYWTYVAALDAEEHSLKWHEFRNKYREFGGDGIYAAWQLTHLEPVFKGRKLSPEQQQEYDVGLCPVAESLQPKLLQFKGSYMDMDDASRAADALHKTIQYFDG